MKYLLLMLALVTGLAHSDPRPIDKSDPGYIRQLGTGKTFEQAKQNAFKNAIALLVGSAVISENEALNGKMMREELIDYSAGYIDNYAVIDVTSKPDGYTVIMDIIVRPSKIHERVLNQGKDSKNVPGEQLGTQYRSYLQERKDGDRFLSTVLGSYPKNAFEVSQKPFQYKLDMYRNAIFIVPFEMRWSYKYIQSLNETLQLLQDGDKNSPEKFLVMAKDPNDWLFGKSNEYVFNDVVRANNIKNVLNAPVYMKASLLDINNKPVYSNCYLVTGNFSAVMSNRTYAVYGNEVLRSTVQLQVSQNQIMGRMEDVNRVELSLTRQCTNDKYINDNRKDKAGSL